MMPRLALLAVAVTLANCVDHPSAPVSVQSAYVGMRLDTTSHALAADSAITVAFTVENRIAGAVLLPRCGEHLGLHVEVWADHQWKRHSAAICPANQDMSPLRLAGRATLRGERRITAGPGAYRLVLPFRRESDGDTRIGYVPAATPVFTVEPHD